MSDCGVCLGGGEADCYAEMYDVNLVTSRKPFKCDECRRDFPVKTNYMRHSGMLEGKFFTHKECLDCKAIRLGLSCDESNGIIFGEMWTDMRDHGFANLTTGCLSKIESAEARAYLVQRWQEWKGLNGGTK